MTVRGSQDDLEKKASKEKSDYEILQFSKYEYLFKNDERFSQDEKEEYSRLSMMIKFYMELYKDTVLLNDVMKDIVFKS